MRVMVTILLLVCTTFVAKSQQVITITPTMPDKQETETIHVCSSDPFPLLLSTIEPNHYITKNSWYFNGELIQTDRVLAIHETGVYKLVASGEHIALEKTIVVDMPIPYACETIIPNVFTPNGDGHNDNFSILNIEHYPNSTLEVYARWGRKVFSSNGYRNEWNGADQPDGTYFFIFKRADGQEFKGSVTILR